ncbi:Disease resistance protein RPM1 [Dichanthelium oligosanthes]|uniref:Disease resistance protein RPM1 n=1 Tax=Dichanthelium oligosanthes TaxID=888268 RepID=A0A1E5VLR4_9POAL|nr:Disease resistance protein RPM1 [Dichanthelium oligosanthes]
MEPMVCYSMGAINSLVEKVTPLMESHPMTEHLLQGLKSLRDDLMNKFVGGRVKGEQVKVWMKQAREMVYDIEDWIDLKPVAANFSESDMKQIEEFKDEIQEARSRCERYELLKKATSDEEQVYAGPREVPRRRLFWEEKTDLVGMDGQKSKLLNHLKNEQKELKVVSIHGTGGHGKTALAKDIYGDIYITAQFQCQAFVSVCRTSSMKTTLIEILRQVKSEEDALQSWSSNDEQINEIITELWELLRTKRYFICIDDIRSTQDLEVIICALPDNNLGSRILTTTCLEEIAISCTRRPTDVVYEMIVLDATHSKRLFCSSAYVQEEEWPDHFKESSNKIFEVCGGVPLAIIITAGFLGRTSTEMSLQSKKLNKTILSEFDQFHSEPRAIRKILEISYADLPLPLKSCFLYLTAFSRNYDIKKDRLIRRWVAEGLIPERHGESSWETGESYFDELISRRLIQPAFDDNDDQPIGCTVQGVVFDFLESLSSEENFITPGVELKSGLSPCERVRRVNLDFGDDDEDDTLISSSYCLLEEKSLVASSSDEDNEIFLHLSRVRSLAFSGDAGRIPDLSAFKHLRVLDLEDTKDLENKQLEGIGHLSLLRYLGLAGADVTKLPQQIMALEQLTTLDLRRTRVIRLPGFRDTKLVSLLADELVLTPREMRRMQNLEELSKVRVGPDGSLANELAGHVNKLGPLRMLGIRFSHLHRYNQNDRQGVKRLLEELGKSNLEFLLLDNYHHPLLDLLVGSWSQNLRNFDLRIRGCLPQVPQEIASLIALTHLHINVEAVEAEAVRALGSLPKLVLLKLDSNTSPSLTLSIKDGFQCLKVLCYNSQYGGGKGMQFEVGAMPQLRRLRLDLDAQETMPKHDDFFFGIKNLPCLVHVHATIDWKKTLARSEVEAAEAQIREQVSRNPNNPVLELNRRRQRSVAKAAELVTRVNSLQEWDKQIDPRKLVVIHFTAEWCRPSRRMTPVFADLAKKFRNIVFLKVDVDVDEMNTVATALSVEGVPTFLFMKGGYVKDRVVGADKEELEEVLAEQVDLM